MVGGRGYRYLEEGGRGEDLPWLSKRESKTGRRPRERKKSVKVGRRRLEENRNGMRRDQRGQASHERIQSWREYETGQRRPEHGRLWGLGVREPSKTSEGACGLPRPSSFPALSSARSPLLLLYSSPLFPMRAFSEPPSPRSPLSPPHPPPRLGRHG